MKNFGVKDLLDALAAFAPPPRAQAAEQRTVDAHENAMTGFVFKIQANMDPNHRDRIAFARLCSGKLRRGMKAKLVRTGKPMTLSAPQFFFAQDRALADEAYAGDIVGIPNHGTLRIGDTLTEGEEIAFLGVPNFAPEILRRVQLGDPMKAKKLKEALQQMAEEGVVQVFRPLDGAPALVGVVGPLAARRAEGPARRTNTASTSASRRRNSSSRAGLPAPTPRSSTISCRPTIPASPRISTATACSWRATSSSSTTRASARPASCSPTSRM